jgi:uncharacterized protein (TIGR02594 family)
MKYKTILEQALSYYGQQAIVGYDTNKIIERFYEEAGHPEIKGDETPWCAAFLNAVLFEMDAPNTGSLLARSFLNLGINTDKPEMGDIVVFWRESKESWKGHVGIVIRVDGSMVYALAGNDNNMVAIHPYSTHSVLGYRKLSIEM